MMSSAASSSAVSASLPTLTQVRQRLASGDTDWSMLRRLLECAVGDEGKLSSDATGLLQECLRRDAEAVRRFLYDDEAARRVVERALGGLPAQSEAQFRVLAVLTSLAALSGADAQRCEAAWRLGERLRCCVADESDPLARMAALSLVEELGASDGGFELLRGNGTLALFERLLDEPLLAAQAVSVYCRLLQARRPLDVPPALLPLLENAMRPGHEQLGLALMASAVMAATPSHRQLVIDNAPLLARYAAVCSTRREAAVLELFFDSLRVHLLGPDVDDTLFDRLARLADESPLRVVMHTLLRRGHEELRLVALGLLCNLVARPWGARLLIDFPGFFDFIVDRSTESSPDGWHAKYRIISTLLNAHADDCRDFFDEQEMASLHAYLVDGPVYAPRTPATVKVADDAS